MDELYTVAEVSKILKTDVHYVYRLQKSGLLRFMKMGSLKCRRSSLEAFLTKWEGWDLSDPYNPIDLEDDER